MDRYRIAELVVVDREGTVLGVTEPVTVAQPWWQEVDPIIDAVPDTVVLRLLHAEPETEQPMGGRVSYLIENDRLAADPRLLRPWSGRLDSHPLRLPWAHPGGPTADLAWVSSVVADITGPPRQHRTWNLSAIWSIPTARGRLWLKCLPPFFRHEPAVLSRLADPRVPEVVAADGHRLLLAEMAGRDGHGADDKTQVAMVTALVELQLDTADRVDEFLAAGVPDLRAHRLIDELTGLVRREAPDDPVLGPLLRELPHRLAVADDFGLPDTLVHGDPHDGNCRARVEPPIWFDWGDSFIGNPLLDLGALHRMRTPAVDVWLALLARRARSGVTADRLRWAWSTLAPVAALRMAWVYQRILDQIEPSEHVYHRDDVADQLNEARRLASVPGPG